MLSNILYVKRYTGAQAASVHESVLKPDRYCPRRHLQVKKINISWRLIEVYDYLKAIK